MYAYIYIYIYVCVCVYLCVCLFICVWALKWNLSLIKHLKKVVLLLHFESFQNWIASSRRILSQKTTWNFWIWDFRALENHILVNMLLFTIHFTKLKTFPTFVSSRRSFKTALFRRFLKVAIATPNVMGKIQNGGFALEFIVSVLKEIKALVRSYVHEMKLGKF